LTSIIESDWLPSQLSQNPDHTPCSQQRNPWQKVDGTEGNGESQMNSLHKHCRAYYPEALQKMGSAFDKAVDALPADYKILQGGRQELALLIIRLFEEGVTNPAHLCKRALNMCAPTSRLVSEREGRGHLERLGHQVSVIQRSLLASAAMGRQQRQRIARLRAAKKDTAKAQALLDALANRVQRMTIRGIAWNVRSTRHDALRLRQGRAEQVQRL
jgi:hypothetical protein